jgi:hypothetical protein
LIETKESTESITYDVFGEEFVELLSLIRPPEDDDDVNEPSGPMLSIRMERHNSLFFNKKIRI